ncbi:hypothetical protein NDU88_007130 [Pleurodeles waltl]|uniref:Uncharacterized protein n=1 Tax=Pleurodeles waltl TaxID=8319 RepID=A0AAV7WFK2_PLEWA|nr:hypothetical protein NDU88_007130 [Pleurodeles waltl]
MRPAQIRVWWIAGHRMLQMQLYLLLLDTRLELPADSLVITKPILKHAASLDQGLVNSWIQNAPDAALPSTSRHSARTTLLAPWLSLNRSSSMRPARIRVWWIAGYRMLWMQLYLVLLDTRLELPADSLVITKRILKHLGSSDQGMVDSWIQNAPDAALPATSRHSARTTRWIPGYH